MSGDSACCQAQLRNIARFWLRAQQCDAPDFQHNRTRIERTGEIPPNDRRLLWLWQNIRITFLPKSSDLKRYRNGWPALLIRDTHDWPAAPCPVHQISDLLKHRVHDITTKSKTGPKPQPRA